MKDSNQNLAGSDDRANTLGSWADTVKVVTRGRVTGLPHIVRVRFVRDGEDFLTLAGSRESDWVKNVESSGEAKVRLGELSYSTEAHMSETDRARAVELFDRKYGKRIVRDWYGGSSVCVRFVPHGPATTVVLARGEGSVQKSYSAWKQERRPYYGDVASAFDLASEEYDVTIGRNLINTLIRDRSLEVLFRIVRKDDVLVEIGAGTGTEAIQVAKRVAGVYTTDISQSMVDLLSLKAKAKRMGDRVHPLKLGAAQIGKLGGVLPRGKVRVAYSFNGALNCEPQFEEFLSGLSSIVETGGYFVCSIRNTLCLAEMLTYAILLRKSGMEKRKVQPMMVSVGGMDIPSTYFPAGEFARKFSGDFELVKMVGLPTLLPPAYLNDYYVKARRVLRVFEAADRALGSSFPFNRVGDQTLYVFRKK